MTAVPDLRTARTARLIEALRSLPTPAPTTAELARCTGLTAREALKLLQRLEGAGTVIGLPHSVSGRFTYQWRLR